LGALPIVDWFCHRLGLGELLEAVVPHVDLGRSTGQHDVVRAAPFGRCQLD
jgi:hypothetical protein